jgi:hypothetical protein
MSRFDERQLRIALDNQNFAYLMNKKTQVMNDLNTFNQKYVEYIKCNNTCPNSSTVSSEYNASVTNLKKNLDEYKRAIDILESQGTLKKNTEYNSLITPGITTNSENNRLRSELDAKLKEVYNINGVIANDGLVQYNSVIYTEILFTILATTLLYFTFTKL